MDFLLIHLDCNAGKSPWALRHTHYTKWKKNGRGTGKRTLMNTTPTTKKRRIILWLLVVIYLSPSLYRCNIWLTLRWSPEFTGFLPTLMLLMGVVAYLFYSVKAKLLLKKCPFYCYVLVFPSLLYVLSPTRTNIYIYQNTCLWPGFSLKRFELIICVPASFCWYFSAHLPSGY